MTWERACSWPSTLCGAPAGEEIGDGEAVKGYVLTSAAHDEGKNANCRYAGILCWLTCLAQVKIELKVVGRKGGVPTDGYTIRR